MSERERGSYCEMLIAVTREPFFSLLACVHRRAGATPVLPITDPRGLGRLWVCRRCWGDCSTAVPPAQESEDRDMMTALLLAPRGTSWPQTFLGHSYAA